MCPKGGPLIFRPAGWAELDGSALKNLSERSQRRRASEDLSEVRPLRHPYDKFSQRKHRQVGF
jgi:hypothetical protein